MKIIGKKGKNTILEVTEYELKAIKTALLEWQLIENETFNPVKNFGYVFDRLARAENKFKELPLYNQVKKLKE